ncbi:MAG TPA: hypothetical protein VGH99_05360 [Pseudonocardia sp.]
MDTTAGEDITADELWIDVGMCSGLSGKVQAFADVECEAPEEPPASSAEWTDWAVTHLASVARQDDWQPGRYHYSVQQRNSSGHSMDTFAQGFWDYRT